MSSIINQRNNIKKKWWQHLKFSIKKMKTYLVGYDGNSSRFQGRTFEVLAENEREAVENIYMEYLNENYFPQEDGSILDCSGNIIAEADDEVIEYDGGCFAVYSFLNNMSFE